MPEKNFEILPLEYFEFKNMFSGSKGDFNYKIIPKEQLEVIVWYGRKCSQKSEIIAENSFEFKEESRNLICEWLEEQYKIFDRWRLKQYLNSDEN